MKEKSFLRTKNLTENSRNKGEEMQFPNIQNSHNQIIALTKRASAINTIINAVEHSMGGQNSKKVTDEDTIFFAGPVLTVREDEMMERFVADKGWMMIYLGFCVEKLLEGIEEIAQISCFIPSSLTQAAKLERGKLWQATPERKIAIVFPEANMKCFLSSKGSMIFREAKQPFHEEGFEIARSTVRHLCSEDLASSPVIGNVDEVPVVFDLATLAKAHRQS